MSSRDEVFKEIQDFGEDNSVSSLHLLFGNMDLPPSSYHDSLEELWDKEEELEEVETMIKIVPSSCHQYLDVFSKVKAEKLPPNHACHHHKEVVVVTSSWGDLLFIKPRDGGLHLCVDYRKLNAVTRKNKYPVPPMSQLLTVSNDSFIFPKIDLPGAYNLLRIKEGDGHLTCFRTKSDSHLLSSPWAEFLSGFHFSIFYHAGHLATLPDALSCWAKIYPERGEDFIRKNPMNYQQIIKPDKIKASNLFEVKVDSFSTLIDSIQKALWKDSQYRSVLQYLGKGKAVQEYSLDSSSQLLLFKDWVVAPNAPKIQLIIFQKKHDSHLARHSGQEKTLKLVKHDFHWSGMTQFVKDYVSSCQQFSKNKNILHKKFGLLKRLPIENGPRICLSMDLITQLPLSNYFDSILVIADRFAKMEVFIPKISSIASLDLAHLFMKNIFSNHGLPSRIVGDRGSIFCFFFLNQSLSEAKDFRDLSTSYHSETDGQTERVNQILE
ncbi:hypothetical protein O181_037956 [Austropuccinia psidii MF-1]|uniref:Integrase catalytic domain-containing protein n=1 Tax=Austropuccinia psidii MF-1 TaxID=1389203 RepID=A0A9Q3D758_9BASI|nr:hypothetical protein [Austropuccinia psidii MF-1]